MHNEAVLNQSKQPAERTGKTSRCKLGGACGNRKQTCGENRKSYRVGDTIGLHALEGRGCGKPCVQPRRGLT